MQWIILDRSDEQGRRLEAVRLTDGARRVLVAHEQATGYFASVDPTGRLVGATVTEPAPAGRSTTRCALVDLERQAVRWLSASLDADWHLHRMRFADTGRRIVAEGAFGAALAHDIYVFGFDPDHPLDAEAQALLAGAGNPERMGLRSPLFAPGGQQVFFLRRTAGDLFQVIVLDVDKEGDSAEPLKSRAPSRRELVLTEPMRIAAEAGLEYCPSTRLLYFAYLLGGRQRLARKPLTGQPPRAFWRAHESIDCLVADPDGAGAVYAAEGQLWWADLQLDDVISLVEHAPGLAPDLLRCLPGGWVLYGTHDEFGANLYALHRPSRAVENVWGGPGRLLGFAMVPDDDDCAARLAALPEGPLADYVPADDELKALAAAQAAEEAAEREAEARAAAEAEQAAREALRQRAEAFAAEALAEEEARIEAQALREAEIEARREAARSARAAAKARSAEQAARAAEAEATLEADAARQAAAARHAEAAREAEAEAAREAEAEAHAAREAEARAAREAEARAAREAAAAREALAAREAKAQAALDAQAAREAEARAAREAEARADREAQAAREAEARAAESARWAAERKAARAAESARIAREEREAREAEARRRTAEAQAAFEADAARRAAELQAERDAEDARRSADLRAARALRERRAADSARAEAAAAEGGSAPPLVLPPLLGQSRTEPEVAPVEPEVPAHEPDAPPVSQTPATPEPEPGHDAVHAEPPVPLAPLLAEATPPATAPVRTPNLPAALPADVAALGHVFAAGFFGLPWLYAVGALWTIAAIALHVGWRGAAAVGSLCGLAAAAFWARWALDGGPVSFEICAAIAVASLSVVALARFGRRRMPR